jgi:hypothetical protein
LRYAKAGSKKILATFRFLLLSLAFLTSLLITIPQSAIPAAHNCDRKIVACLRRQSTGSIGTLAENTRKINFDHWLTPFLQM